MHLPITESHETNVSFSFQTTSVSSWFAADIPRCLRLLVLLLLLFEQLVDLPLGHGRVLWDEAVLVHARQEQQEAHCGGRKSCLYHRWIPPNQRSSWTPKYSLDPVKGSSNHSYSDALFLAAPERLRVVRWAPNYVGEDKLAKTCPRGDTPRLSSSDYEEEAVKMLRHNRRASFFPSGSFTCWHSTNYWPQQDPLAQTELIWAEHKIKTSLCRAGGFWSHWLSRSLLRVKYLAGSHADLPAQLTFRRLRLNSRLISRLLRQVMCRVHAWALQFVTNGEDITPRAHETSPWKRCQSTLPLYKTTCSVHITAVTRSLLLSYKWGFFQKAV